MEFGVWLSFFLLFMAGGLTPGPAVMLVTTSSIRYGFWAAMIPSVGICLANLVWIVLAVSGATALAHAFPLAFIALKVVGIAFILGLVAFVWGLAWIALGVWMRSSERGHGSPSTPLTA